MGFNTVLFNNSGNCKGDVREMRDRGKKMTHIQKETSLEEKINQGSQLQDAIRKGNVLGALYAVESSNDETLKRITYGVLALGIEYDKGRQERKVYSPMEESLLKYCAEKSGGLVSYSGSVDTN